MTKRMESKYKIDRRMGENIWGRPKSPVNRREYGPGQHGQRRKSKLSDYGVQLKAKQKLRGYYGNISERQFRGIYQEARRLKGDSGAHMIGLLERRLDALIFRAKFVPTVFAARQFINHGHIKVNGKRVTIPSYRVKVGDVVEVKEKSKQLALVLEAQALAERDVPDYIEVDTSKLTAKLARVPVNEPSPGDRRKPERADLPERSDGIRYREVEDGYFEERVLPVLTPLARVTRGVSASLRKRFRMSSISRARC